ncbi:hypothetical protein EYB33_19020 [Lysinibacillus sphaericus]|uniref:hypothetical protein n=1 Tax=Lysinibacillus sphaericus TaxID=1421 RepID=UPI001E3B5D2D|nr:hypothetical protein [Lysinibacillus sphaericus]UDK98232.1 hypothetical protein EYB33_19020 [Lysinibacillus sphaericus]
MRGLLPLPTTIKTYGTLLLTEHTVEEDLAMHKAFIQAYFLKKDETIEKVEQQE